LTAFLPRDATQSAVFLIPMHRLSLSESSWKIISRLVCIGCSLFADPNTTDLLQGNTRNFDPKWHSTYKSSDISETRQDRTKVTIEDQ